MHTMQNLLFGLATLVLLVSTATSWALSLYPDMNDCTCMSHDGTYRQDYLIYSGTGFSSCMTTGIDNFNATCQHFINGATTAGPCDHYMKMGAFAVGQNTYCSWGYQCEGHHAFQYGHGECFDGAAYEEEGEQMFFKCTDVDDPDVPDFS